ncbi:EAL domain-containing protein [Massilia sp. DD77]|uniref:EAL domain-containing protein n=1 Tax=Massilia sp. DD77 TaxID=3109349 RepID=UPI002FFE50CB
MTGIRHPFLRTPGRPSRRWRARAFAGLALCLALLALLAPAAWAASARELRIGIYNNEPKLFIDGQGRAAGILVDLLEEVAKAEGWTLRFVPCAWSGCLAMLERGDIDLLPDVAYTDERAMRLSYHRTPALLSWSQLYRGSVKVASILDLKDKRVAVLERSVQAAFLPTLTDSYGLNTRFIATSSLDQAFQLVREGKADLAAANKFYGDGRAADYGLQDTPIVFLPARLFYAARRGAHGAELAAIDRHLAVWQAQPDSVYFRIIERWQLRGSMHESGMRMLWLLGLAGALLLAALAAALRFRRQATAGARALRDTEIKLATILDSVDSPVYIKDAGFRYCYANGALGRMLGMPPADIIGKDDFELFGPDHAPALRAHDVEVMRDGGRKVFEESAYDPGGERRTFLSTKVSLALEVGATRYLCGISSDISGRKQMEESVRLAATVFQSHEGMLVLGADRAIVDANGALCTMSGYALSELVGSRTLPFLLSRDGRGLDERFWDMLEAQQRWQGDAWGQRTSGALYPALLSVSAVPDEAGRIAHYVCTVSDITELKQTQERNQRLAYYDELTGLPNRRLLFERVQSCLSADRGGAPVGALLFLDLDNFKDLNDTRGHVAGDQLLQHVARRLGACVRGNDTVARLGGDEFVVMLDAVGADEEEARLHTELLAEKILAAVSAPYEIGGMAHHASCSIGITLCTHADESLDLLMKRGDLAMYQAKADGRNTLRFFEPWMEQRVQRRMQLEVELRNALTARQLELFYQPQVEGSRVIGAEALLRWRHPERGLIGPAEFIGVAENTDLILPIGAWVLRAACEQLVRWSAAPASAHLTVAVNISIRQLMEDGFVRDTLDTIAATGADPSRLKLELTESMVIDRVEETIEKMEELRRHGVCFSLDDFGTGYSSLAYLKRLPLEQLKIDRSFVRDILVDPNDASIARSVVALAQALGLSIIAEGVETEEQRAMLQELGCQRYQGYLFGKPGPADGIGALLAVSVTS